MSNGNSPEKPPPPPGSGTGSGSGTSTGTTGGGVTDKGVHKPPQSAVAVAAAVGGLVGGLVGGVQKVGNPQPRGSRGCGRHAQWTGNRMRDSRYRHEKLQSGRIGQAAALLRPTTLTKSEALDHAASVA